MTKLELEEEKLKEEIKTIKRSRRTDLPKTIAVILLPIALFFAIQLPGSLLNQKISNESISRERAKLVCEIIDDKDVLLKLSAIKKAYPEKDNDWINEIEEIYRTRIEKLRNSIDSTYNTEVSLLKVELGKLLDKKEILQIQLVSEMSGINRNDRMGTDQLKSEINKLNDQIHRKQLKVQVQKLVDEAREIRNPSQADDVYRNASDIFLVSYPIYKQKTDSIIRTFDENTRVRKWDRFFREIGY